MTIAEFVASSPSVFWALIYIAWGSTYGAITIALAVLYVAAKRELKERPKARPWLAMLQLLWAAFTLLAVFGFPLMIGALSKEMLVHGRYDWWWIGSWFVTVGTAWLMTGRRFRRSDLG